jgi:hypothetical protein
MTIDPALIGISTYALAKMHISERHREEYNRYRKKHRILHKSSRPPLLDARKPVQPSLKNREIDSLPLKLNHQIDVEKLLIAAQIGKPH